MREHSVHVAATLKLKRTNIGKAQQPAYEIPTPCGGRRKKFVKTRRGVTGIKTVSDDALRLCGDIHEHKDETPTAVQTVQSTSGRKGEADCRKNQGAKEKKKKIETHETVNMTRQES